MSKLHPTSTLERPHDRVLRSFSLGQIGADTVRTYLRRGCSLAICCRDCPRLIEWTPPDLEAKFGHRLDLRIADIAARLSCTGEGGCGAQDVAVFPHSYDLPNRQRCVPGEQGLPPEAASRAIDEYLAVLDDAAFGAATPVTPKFISPADPASRWTGANKGLAFFAYATNYLIDLDHAVIVDVEPSTAIRTAEVTAARTMIQQVREQHDLSPDRLAADSAYGSAEMLDWLVNDQGVEPHIPVIDKSGRDDGTFSRKDFTYDPAADLYRCPGGKELKQHRRAFRGDHPDVPPDDTYRYRASKADCDACSLRSRCCPNTPARKVTRSIYEAARDRAREIATTDAYVTSRRERKKVEMLFAHLKRILKLDRLRLRGPCGARDEFLLAATAQNLRKLAKLIPAPAPATA